MVAEKDKGKFKTCDKNPFCTLHRNKKEPEPPGVIDKSQIQCNGTHLKAPLVVDSVKLYLDVCLTSSGAVRVRIDEDNPRWKPPGVFVESGIQPVQGGLEEKSRSDTNVTFSLGEVYSIQIDFDPFKLVLFENGDVLMVVNGFQEFYYQTGEIIKSSRKKQYFEGKEIIDWGEDGKPIFANETDEKAFEKEEEEEDDSSVVSLSGTGNEIGVDIAFVGSKGLFGIPERTTPFFLPNTKHQHEPYRLYNLDVYAYEVGDPMGLYGNIPLLFSKGNSSKAMGILWNNPSDTYLDLSDERLSISGKEVEVRKAKWMSEAGNFDLVIYPGRSLSNVMKQIRDTTGPQLLPPMFSLGYHQCRYSYNDQKDFLEVNQGFEEHNIPMDVLWLDIDHTDGRRYFTFDKEKFPDPIAMYKEIESYGRKAVNIVDPHIKRDDNYIVHQESTKQGYYLKNADGNDFSGWCWPGSSSYIDFSHEPARKFWASMFDTDKYKDTINGVVHIWNDMNEPSVFNTEEVTVPKDCKNVAGAEFREFHNLWGMLYHSSSQAGLLHRDLSEQKITNDSLVWRNLCYDEERTKLCGKDVTLQRGFVLSRAFYAGTQRAGAIWTGDNTAEWCQLKISIPMLLSMGIAGLSFVGSDVGGFFGDPSPELLVRWYQSACLQPFFRGHADLHTKRREPWLFGKENTDRIRDAINLRYMLLPYIYSVFLETERTGLPVMRPLFMNFVENDSLLSIEDQWMIGDSLMVAPVLDEGVKSREVIFPEGKWYNLLSYECYAEEKHIFPVNMESQLVFLREGHILPLKCTKRKTTSHMKNDPFTLLVALDKDIDANGSLYIDDEFTYDYADKDAFCKVQFKFHGNEFTSSVTLGNLALFKPSCKVERISLIGDFDAASFKSASFTTNGIIHEGSVTSSSSSSTSSTLVVSCPKEVVISEPFTMRLH